MGVTNITLPDGRKVTVPIAGDKPTPAELERIQAQLSRAQRAQASPVAPVDPDADPDARTEHAVTPPGPLLRTSDIQMLGQGAGAAIGGFAAAPGGITTPAGMLLGAGAGQTVADLLIEGGRRMGAVGEGGFIAEDVPGGGQGGLGGTTERAVDAMAWEAAGGHLLPAAARMTFDAGRRFVVGPITEGASRLLHKAQGLGVGLGVEALTGREALTSFRRVFGQFPFIGKPMKDQDAKASAQLGRALDQILDAVGPHRDTGRVGQMLRRRAKGRYVGLKMSVAKAYDDAFVAAREAGAVMLPNNFRAKAQEVFGELALERRPKIEVERASGILDEFGEPIMTIERVPLPRPVQTLVESFAKKVRDLEDTITLDQYQDLMFDLEDIVTKSAAEGLRMTRAIDLKKALREDLGSISDPMVASMMQRANAMHASVRQLFESTTGQRFGRVNPKEFRLELDEAGVLNEDELFKAVFNSRSVDALQDLYKLVGERGFRTAARRHLQDVVDKAREQATKDLVINVTSLRRGLGMVGARSPEQKAAEFMLKKSGVDPANLRDFLDVLEAVSDNGAINVSSFLTRRVRLGGISTLRNLFTQPLGVRQGAATGAGAAAAFANPVATAAGAVMFFLSGRHFARFLSDPEKLRLATTVLAPIQDTALRVGPRNLLGLRQKRAVRTTPDVEALVAAKRSAAIRLLRLIAKDGPELGLEVLEGGVNAISGAFGASDDITQQQPLRIEPGR